EDVATMEFDGRGVCFSPGCGLEGSPQPLAHRHTAAEPSSNVVARVMVGIRCSPPRDGYEWKEPSIGAADDGGTIYGHRSAMPVPRPAERAVKIQRAVATSVTRLGGGGKTARDGQPMHQSGAEPS